MRQALLDTDILSEFLRGNEQVAENAERYLLNFEVLTFSVITFYEIKNGLLYRDAKKQLKKFTKLAELSNIVPLTVADAEYAARIQADLRMKGEQIGHADTLIAGIALNHGFELITNNTRHFKRIKQLQTSNWTKQVR
jgi:tRNA(fMet)-specific endonuclease VapC